MKVAFITPISILWNIGSMTNFHMILPEQLDNAEYRNFYRNATGFKMLDNGIAEGNRINNGVLIAEALGMRVDEIVCPDVMQDYSATVYHTEDFIEYLRQVGLPISRWRLAGVVQGENHTRAHECLMWMLTNPNISTICIPRVFIKQFGSTARLDFIEEYGSLITQRFGKEIHLLGSGPYPEEIRIINKGSTPVRSIDTCAPIAMAMKGVQLDDHNRGDAQYTGRPSDYFTWDLDYPDGGLAERSRWLTIKNTNTFLAWAEEPVEPITS